MVEVVRVCLQRPEDGQNQEIRVSKRVWGIIELFASALLVSLVPGLPGVLGLFFGNRARSILECMAWRITAPHDHYNTTLTFYH